MKIKSINQNIKLLKYNRVRCDICKIDIHSASYARHLKSKKHLENFTQNKVNIPRKDPIKRVVKQENKVSDIDTKVENQNCFSDRILKVAFAIAICNHSNKNANSQIKCTSNFNNIGIDIIHTTKIIIEKGYAQAKCGEIKDSTHVKLPLGSSALIITKNDKK